jgi:hypothetical protein
MSSLDDKLEKILNEFGNSIKDQSAWMTLGGEFELKKDPIALIKQAFIDEGYIKIPQIVEVKGKLETSHNFVDVNNMRYMTGQDWYDKFYAEYCVSSSIDLDYNASETINTYVLEAAKKASGIK